MDLRFFLKGDGGGLGAVWRIGGWSDGERGDLSAGGLLVSACQCCLTKKTYQKLKKSRTSFSLVSCEMFLTCAPPVSISTCGVFSRARSYVDNGGRHLG